MAGLLEEVLGIARGYVRGGVSISVKTNLGPEIPVAAAAYEAGDTSAGGAGGGGGIARLFGLRAAVVVRDGSGAVISTFGEIPKTDPVRAVIAWTIAAGVVFLVVRGALK